MGAFKDLSLRLSGASPSAARSIKSQFIREQSGERFDGVLNAFSLARLLGGEAQGDQILAPGPGHSARDRSLSILIDPTAPDGFTCHSFAGDDWTDCKDYVLAEIEKALVARMNAALDRQLALSPEESAAELELWKSAPDDLQGRPIDFGDARPARRADPSLTTIGPSGHGSAPTIISTGQPPATISPRAASKSPKHPKFVATHQKRLAGACCATSVAVQQEIKMAILFMCR